MNLTASKVLDFFNESDKQTLQNKTYSKKTVVGIYVPCSVEHLYLGVSYLINKDVIKNTSLLCDAGCGDGRVIATTAGVFLIPSLGIEYDSEIVLRAKSNISKLKEQKIIDRTRADILEGDFTTDSTYDNAGITFLDVNVFINYVNNQKLIAKKIGKQSPEGTIFILHDGRPIPERFPKLNLEFSLELIDNSNNVNMRLPFQTNNLESYYPLPDRAFMHVYKKY